MVVSILLKSGNRERLVYENSSYASRKFLKPKFSILGITFTDGEFWAVQRHFVVRHLRDLGFGKQLMEERIKEELEEVLSIIDSTNSDVPISPILAPAIINVLWTLTAGTRISRDNQQLQKLLDLMDARAKAFDMSGGALTRYPWLRHVLPEGTGYNLIKRLNGELYSFFMKSINEHHEKWSEGKNEDLIYAFITEMKRQDPKTDTTFTGKWHKRQETESWFRNGGCGQPAA